jgi:bifunctional DNase/RNase
LNNFGIYIAKSNEELILEVEMKIRGLMMDPITNMPIVILKEAEGNAILPIWVGVSEANAIALEIEKVVTPRPMTHDLLKNVLIGLDSHVQRIVVTAIKEDTFYAVIWIQQNGRLISVDSRPSDALALALRIDCPILATDEVLQKSKGPASNSDQMPNEDLKRWLDMDDEDMGKYKM